MPTAELPAVAMWYDERGHGDPCVLLHPGGAGVDSRALRPTLEALAKDFRVYAPEHRAHGRTPDVAGPASYELMAADTIAFIETVIGAPVHLLGCSDGAVVALVVALRRPDLVRRLVLAAGVFHRDGWAKGVLDGEPPDFLERSYGELSPDGIGHYGVVVAKLAAMHAREPALTHADLRSVGCRTMVMVADDDEVRLEHAIEAYRSLPDAELAVVPGTSHGLLVEKPGLCNLLITEFLTKDPVATFAPIRRAAPTRQAAPVARPRRSARPRREPRPRAKARSRRKPRDLGVPPGQDGGVESLAELRERRAFECRLVPDRALRSLDEADGFLRDRGLLTRTTDCALPSLYEACHDDPYRPGRPGFATWPAEKWQWFGELAERGHLITAVHCSKNLLVSGEMAALLDPICRAEIERMRAFDAGWRRVLDHLAAVGPSSIEDLRTELRLKRQELKALRSPLERCGAVVSRSMEVTAGAGEQHASMLARWDQAYPGGGDTGADPARALGDLVAAGVRAAVVAPEAEPRRWFSWQWYWSGTLIDDLVRAGRLRRVDGYLAAP